MLKTKQKAPKFTINDILGHEIAAPIAGKWTYISFHRFTACPFCVLRTRELIKAYPLFEQNNIEIISIWPSSKANMLTYVGTENAPFPMVADENRELFKKYHVIKSSGLSAFKLLMRPLYVLKALKGKYKNIEIDADPNLLPAEFLISPDGQLLRVFYGTHFGDHLPISTIISLSSDSI